MKDTNVEAIILMMDELGITVDRAMDALEIPENDREEYKAKVEAVKTKSA